MPRRLIVAISGASGAIYGVRVLEELRAVADVETHLIVSRPGMLNVKSELGMDRERLHELADVVHSERNIGATVASGSFAHDGMLVVPCSVKTLACVATGVADNLIARAADVTLKERRRLLLMVRETPLNLVHLRNMTTVAEMGGIIFPPVPAMYMEPATVTDIVNQTVGRALSLFGIDVSHLTRSWQGLIRGRPD